MAPAQQSKPWGVHFAEHWVAKAAGDLRRKSKSYEYYVLSGVKEPAALFEWFESLT